MSVFIIEKMNETKMEKVPFATFMEWALYDETNGYYMKEKTKIGKDGDYYTASHVHNVFGKVFAKTFYDVLTMENLPTAICEFGGGSGRFAYGVLEEMKTVSPKIFSQLTYILIEASPYHRKLQQQLLKHFPQVKIFPDLQEAKRAIPHFQGILFSNEWFDALPVHLVEHQDGTLYEYFVAANNNELVWKKEKCQNKKILAWIEKYGPPLKNGQKIEVPLAMTAMLKEIAQWLSRALMFTIDYGYTKEEWSMPERMDGSLRGYYEHQLITNPLLYAGEMDITAHIHLDAFVQIGEELGLKTILSTRQDRFLLQAGILEYLQNHFDPNPFSEQSKQNRAVRSLIMDGGISQHFQVIVQGKNLHHADEYPFLRRHLF